MCVRALVCSRLVAYSASPEVGDEPAMIKAAAAVKSKRLNGLALESLGEKRAMVHLKLASDEASKLVCAVTAAKAQQC